MAGHANSLYLIVIESECESVPKIYPIRQHENLRLT